MAQQNTKKWDVDLKKKAYPSFMGAWLDFYYVDCKWIDRLIRSTYRGVISLNCLLMF